MSSLMDLYVTLPDQLVAASVLGYLDPGAGSMLLQVLIAGVFSSLFFAKSSFFYVRDALLSKKNKV